MKRHETFLIIRLETSDFRKLYCNSLIRIKRRIPIMFKSKHRKNYKIGRCTIKNNTLNWKIFNLGQKNPYSYN